MLLYLCVVSPSFPHVHTNQLKKHDKFSQWSDSSAVLLPRIVRAPFFTSPILKMLLDQVWARAGILRLMIHA